MSIRQGNNIIAGTPDLSVKANTDFSNINTASGADAVIEWKAPTSADPTWYRKYASGWVEQGGLIDLGSDVTSAGYSLDIALSVEMANTYYYRNIIPSGNSGGGQYMGYCCVSQAGCTTTKLIGFFVKTEQSYRYFAWEVKGMGA